MDRVGRRAEGLIRTSVLSIANAARDATLRENADVLKGQQWTATLDVRTCEECAALDGQAWDFDGTPLDGSTQEFPGPPPIHWNDRCTLIPVVKSLGDLLEDPALDARLKDRLDALPKATRTSMDGQVASDLSFADWLKAQSEE
jgi:SPP1 gp7 family putative phage head morphogenesis protein